MYSGFEKTLLEEGNYRSVFLLLSKTGAKLGKGEVLQCILHDLFNAHNLDSYLGPCQISVLELLAKIGNDCFQVTPDR